MLISLSAIRAAEQSAGWMGGIFAMLGVLCLALAYGLFVLKSWAWPMGIAMVAISALVALLSAINRGTLAFLVLSLAPAILLIGGLFLPDVRKAFGRNDGSK
ncbi:MAG: hypothetical protein ACFLMY_18740 [Candidatus Brachytrichaceae bacterium NZ_4S206]